MSKNIISILLVLFFLHPNISLAFASEIPDSEMIRLDSDDLKEPLLQLDSLIEIEKIEFNSPQYFDLSLFFNTQMQPQLSDSFSNLNQGNTRDAFSVQQVTNAFPENAWVNNFLGFAAQTAMGDPLRGFVFSIAFIAAQLESFVMLFLLNNAFPKMDHSLKNMIVYGSQIISIITVYIVNIVDAYNMYNQITSTSTVIPSNFSTKLFQTNVYAF